MNLVEIAGVKVRDCKGSGALSMINYSDMSEPPKICDITVRFAITGKDDKYTISLTAEEFTITGLINSDHILIMKQILKEMGEI